MKKICKLLAVLSACMLLLLPISAYAEEAKDTTADIATDAIDTTDVLDTDDLKTPSVPDDTDNTANSTAKEDTAADEAVTAWDKILDKLTSATLWISIGSYGVSAFALYELVKKKFSGLVSLIKDKTEVKTIVATAKADILEMRSAIDEKVSVISDRIEAEQETIDKMLVIFSVFMANAKINEHAKAEILLMLTGVKAYTGNVAEIVDKVQEAVKAAEAAEEKIATPVLDEIEAEKNVAAAEIVVGGM